VKEDEDILTGFIAESAPDKLAPWLTLAKVFRFLGGARLE